MTPRLCTITVAVLLGFEIALLGLVADRVRRFVRSLSDTKPRRAISKPKYYMRHHQLPRWYSHLTWHGSEAAARSLEHSALTPLLPSRGREADGPGQTDRRSELRSAICALRETHSHPNFAGWKPKIATHSVRSKLRKRA